MNKFDFKQKSVSIEEKNAFNIKVKSTFLDVMVKYGRLSSFSNEFMRKDLAKGLYDVATELFLEIETILGNKSNSVRDILGENFSINGDFEVPLFVILEIIYQCCKSLDISLVEQDKIRMERIIKLTKRYNTSKDINSNWRVDPRILSLLGNNSHISLEKFAEKSTYAQSDENSTILTYNALYFTDVEVPDNGDISLLQIDDEACLASGKEKISELYCDEIYTIKVKDGKDEYRRPIFIEQINELDKKYNSLYNNILSHKMENLYTKFISYIIPYFKDCSFKESALVDSIPWNESEELLSLANSLERLYILMNTYCQNNNVNVRMAFNNYNFLNAISIEMHDLFIVEQKAKRVVINNIIDLINSKSSMIKTIFGLSRISEEILEQELQYLPLAKLHYLNKKLSEKLFGYKEIKEIMKYKKA